MDRRDILRERPMSCSPSVSGPAMIVQHEPIGAPGPAMTAGGADVIVPNAEDAQLRGQASQFAGECLCYASETEALWGRL